jgi:hypothetical protein
MGRLAALHGYSSLPWGGTTIGVLVMPHVFVCSLLYIAAMSVFIAAYSLVPT